MGQKTKTLILTLIIILLIGCGQACGDHGSRIIKTGLSPQYRQINLKGFPVFRTQISLYPIV